MTYKGNKKKNRILESKVQNIEKQYHDTLNTGKTSENLKENIAALGGIFKSCSDFVSRNVKLSAEGPECLLACIDNLVDSEMLNNYLLKPLIAEEGSESVKNAEGPLELIRLVRQTVLSVGNVTETESFKEIAESIVHGSAVLFVDGCSTALSMEMAQWKGRQVSTASVERVVTGPQDAFIENLTTNMSLLRNRLRTPQLKTEKHTIGRLSSTSVIVAYVKGIADEKTVEEVGRRLGKIDIDIIPDSTYIGMFLRDEGYSPFPQGILTERVDRAMANLAEGRIAVLVDGSPNVLIVPVTLADFLSASEDYYDLFYFSSFFRILRYFAFMLALVGPSLYIAITTYHQEMIPLPLLITIAKSRAEVPFPAILEAMLMELTFDILREGGIRLPQSVGPAVSIVGGLVIGQGVVQAGIVSQTMVIVVAITGAASFAIPAFNLSIPIRVMRYPMMVLGAFLGIYGIIMGLLALLIHLVSLRSVGVPYLMPFAPMSPEGLKDSIIKAPTWTMIKRPLYIHPKDKERMKRGLAQQPDDQG